MPERTANRWFTQTLALLVDAYRDLNSRKLFWITLGLNLLVAGAFAVIEINSVGIKVFKWEFPGVWNTNFIPADQFYTFIFAYWGISWWLGFFATLLALLSVCGIFPDLLSGGSIDLYLSKPISRLRLLLTKYIFSLMFAALQVLAFCTAAFVVIGVRGGSWDLRIFLGVPLVVLLFSSLYCVCVLAGIVTRSTIASLVAALVFWGGLFVLNSADDALTMLKSLAEVRLETQKQVVAYNDRLIAENEARPVEARSDDSAFRYQRDVQAARLPDLNADVEKWQWWRGLVANIKAPLPKTNEMIALLNRWTVDPRHLRMIQDEHYDRRQQRRAARGGRQREGADAVDPGNPQVQTRVQSQLLSRSPLYILGTSLLFQGFVLSISAWWFARRDY